jgi:hypothetical protein
MFTITASFHACLNGWCFAFIDMYYTQPPGADVKFSVVSSVALLVAMSVISINLHTSSIDED